MKIIEDYIKANGFYSPGEYPAVISNVNVEGHLVFVTIDYRYCREEYKFDWLEVLNFAYEQLQPKTNNTPS